MSKSRDIADSAATINYIDNVTSDVQSQINTLDTALDNISVTSGTLTKTFANGESASISLTSSVLAPVVSVTKEVPQSGVTNNSWDVNSTTENYTRLDSAYATTLDFEAIGFTLSTASFVDSFSVAGQESSPYGIAFNTDGTKMFIVGNVGADVNEYTLSTGFDVSTATYSQNFSVSSQDGALTGIAFNTDGTKMFIVGRDGDDVNEYTLSTGFDVSTASFVDSFSVSAQDGNPWGLAFNSDGTKMFIVGFDGDDVNEYTLSTGFDISTASYSQSFSVASQETEPRGIAFNTDGTKMFIVGSIGDDVNEYTLSSGFDISTASYSQSFSVSAQEIDSQAIAFNTNGTKMFILGSTGDDVNEYNLTPDLYLALGTGSFASTDVGKTIEANSGAFVLTATDGSYVETTAPTSYDQVASGDWGMYGVVYNATDGDLELSGYDGSYNIADASYDSVSFSVAAQEANPYDVKFNTDGTKMFVIGGSGQDVNEYTLSTAFDISTASFVDSFSVAVQDSGPNSLAFSTDGTKMFVLGGTGKDVNEYTLSTGFDVSTASFVDSFSVNSQDTSPQSIGFNTDGTKMFMLGIVGTDVNEYTLSTGFDVSTASFVDSFSVAAQETYPRGLAFSADGVKMFVIGPSSGAVHRYNLSTGFDVSTAVFSGVSFSVVAQDTGMFGICFNNDGTKMYGVGYSGDSVYQYSTGQAPIAATGYQPVHTTASIDSTYWTDINSMTADQNAGDGNVYYAISTDDRTTWTVIDNTDGERDIVRNNAGTWQYNSNGTYALETWVNGTTNTELATLAEAMEGSVGGYSLANASYDSASFDVSAQDTAPRGLQFSDDGTKMFIVGGSGQDINEYTLSTAFNITTATFVDAFSVAGQETAPYGLAFNTSGTKMFVVGATGDDVNEYALSTGFDVSTASFVDSFSVAAQDVAPVDVAFNTNGTKMYVVGQATEAIYEYTLSTSFDVSTASFVDSFSVAAQDSFPFALAFNLDGTNMFVLTATGFIYQYALTTGFDVSTASYVMDFSVSAQTTGAIGLSFNTTGDKMYVSDQGTKKVYQYTTASYTNQMDKTQLDAVTDPNHIALGNDLDLAIVFNMTSGTTVPSSDGVAINYDANVLNKGAVLGTDYDFDAPTQNSVRITALAANNLKVRVV